MAAKYSATYPAAMKCLLADREGLTAYLRFPQSTTTGSGIPTSSSGPSARPAAAPRSSAGFPGETSCLTLVWAVWTAPPEAGAA